jgi:hypothetical protein
MFSVNEFPRTWPVKDVKGRIEYATCIIFHTRRQRNPNSFKFRWIKRSSRNGSGLNRGTAWREIMEINICFQLGSMQTVKVLNRYCRPVEYWMSYRGFEASMIGNVWDFICHLESNEARNHVRVIRGY